MTIREYYGARGTLAANLGSAGTAIVVSRELADAIIPTFLNGQDAAYLVIRQGSASEVVKVINVEDTTFVVERGPNPQVFAAGAAIEFVLTTDAVIAAISESGIYPKESIWVSGILRNETEPGDTGTTLAVDRPDFEGENGIHIRGSWPNIVFSYSPPANECCPGSGGGGGGDGEDGYITDINASGILSGYRNWDGTYNLSVDEPYFSGDGDIEITGSWPYYNISLTGGGGGSGGGTVVSVGAASGLQITGNPNVNPTISIQNTGVAAGDYSGFVVNMRGQITQLPAGFNPISEVVGADGTITSQRVGGKVTLDVASAAVGQPGVVELADETDPFDPADNASAATPALVALALEGVTKSEVNGQSAYLGESDGDYTNTISGTATQLELLAGEKAIVYGETTVLDASNASLLPTYGIAVFNASPARVKSNRKISQCLQTISFVIEGPVNTSLALATTALPSGMSLASWSFWVTKV